MKSIKIDEVHGSFVVECQKFSDDRGWSSELYSTAKAYPHLIGRERQLNIFSSKKSVVRGLSVASFARLCSCMRGRVYDVVVDMRESSSTYLNWYGIWLDEFNGKQLFVPAGCAHGFFSEQDSLLLCLQDGASNFDTEKVVNWKDPKIGIVWPVSQEYIISQRDKKSEFL